MSFIKHENKRFDGELVDVWIEAYHPENGLFRVYWKDVIDPYNGGATLDPDEGEGLRFEWYYKDGKQEGKALGWFPNGRLKQEGTYKNGKQEGKWTIRNEYGQVVSKIIYEGGYEAEMRKYTYAPWIRNRQRKSAEVLYRHGKKVKEWKIN